MKSSVSFLLLLICTVVLAARQSQAKKGCNAYGLACYGGHGKRSLNLGTNGNAMNQDEIHPDAVLQVLPNDLGVLTEGDNDIPYPRYRLFKIMKNWLNAGRLRHEGIPEVEYPISAENIIRDNTNNNYLN